MDLSILSGPIIGSIIGYGTNWIAIKMLFRPLKPVKIGKFTLPFTPGIIPKRKKKLAQAIGEMVGNNLFTKKDMQEMLLSEDIENMIVNNILTKLESDENIKLTLLEIINEEQYCETRENLKLMISEKIKAGLIKAEVGQIIANEGKCVIQNKVKGSMLRMFVTDDLINSIVEPMGSEIEKYIGEHGQEKIIPMIEREIESFENSSIKNIIDKLDIEKAKIEEFIRDTYKNFVLKYANNLLDKFDISGVVENKINEMEVLEVERLLMSIMKKELGAIVNLGALIGLILGTLNIFL